MISLDVRSEGGNLSLDKVRSKEGPDLMKTVADVPTVTSKPHFQVIEIRR